MKLKNFLINRKILILNMIFGLYIATNLIGGERGLLSYFEKKDIERNLSYAEKLLSIKLYDLKKKNRLLSENVDLDYLDIIYREKLKLGKKEEILIKLK
jgi:cell division protein DivIC